MDQNQDITQLEEAYANLFNTIGAQFVTTLAKLPDALSISILANLMASFEAIASEDHKQILNQFLEVLRPAIKEGVENELANDADFKTAPEKGFIPWAMVAFQGNIFAAWFREGGPEEVPPEITPLILNPNKNPIVN